MHTAYNFFDVPGQIRKVHKEENFRITKRDLDILEFILEMKFSTIEDIHSKFFKFTQQGSQSSCLPWARERIANLVKSDFLKPIRDVCRKTLYIVTQKGYLFLRNSRTDISFSRPLLSVDGRTYDHDQRVIHLRSAMETQGLATNWISERQLSEIDEVKKYLPTEFRPDAIYIDSNGKKVAFELEITRKSKERYQQKIKRYIQVMTENKDALPVFESVHYVCEKQKVLELIQSEVALYLPLFRFSLESEIIQEGVR